MVKDNKAASQIVGVVLMLAIAIILVNLIGFFFLDVGEATNAPPQVGVQMDKVISYETYNNCLGSNCPGASDAQAFTLYHVAGERVDTSDLRVIVDVRKAGQAEITKIPENGAGKLTEPSSYPTFYDEALASGDNPDLFDHGPFGDTYIGSHWSATKPIRFRLKWGGGGVSLNQGDEINVRVVHEPTETVIYDGDVTAR